jgi:hypothetical protein
VSIGLRLRAAFLIQQARYTIGIAGADGPGLAALLAANFLDEVARLLAEVEKAYQDRAIAALEAKQSTGAQNLGLRALKIWRRKVAKRSRRVLLAGTNIPEDMTNIGRSQAAVRVLEDANRMIALLGENLATFDAVSPGTQALIDDGKKLYQTLAIADSAQEQKLSSDLPSAVAAFHAKKAELYTGLKMINEAGHELHADNPPVSARYNLSILYQGKGQSADAPTPPAPTPAKPE